MIKTVDSVRIVVFDRTDTSRFLAVMEADDLGNWKLPGGKFEAVGDGRETPAAAADRELREEVGLTAEAVGLRAAAELVTDDGAAKRYIFVGTADPAAVKPSAEVAQVAWLSEATVPEGRNRGHMLAAVAVARAVRG